MKKYLSNTELIYLCRQLSLILKSGISLLEGISILQEDASSPEGKKLLTDIYEHLLVSGNIPEAFAKTGVFPDYLIHMVSIGELSGNLDETFASLADHYEREENFSKNIRSALAYPMIMLGMLLIVLLVLIMKVMPVFNQVFMELGVEMSGISLHILNLGDRLRQYSFVFLFLLVLLFGFLFYTFRSSNGQKLLRHLPFMKRLAHKTACARFASGLSMTLRSGMDTDASFDLLVHLTEEPFFQEKIHQIQAEIQEGTDFSEALHKSGFFSGMDIRMISLGFLTGSADTVLSKIADRLFDEIDDSMQRIIGYLEPTLVAVLSILVGLILLSVMLPLVGIMSHIG